MDIQVATLCDSATDYHGKLCLLGAFDTIVAGGLPAVHAQCSLALRLVFRRDDEGEHDVSIHFVDEDGKPVVPAIETKLHVMLPPNGEFLTRNVILNLQQLAFPRKGHYAIDIKIDGTVMASIPLQIALLVQPPPANL